MKLIFGLGNPGNQYRRTRHNAGFMVLDRYAEKKGFTFKDKKKYKAEVAEGFLGMEKVMLIKPQTFMNLSGQTVNAVMRSCEVDICDILVIYDDIDLDLGRLRLRKKGSSGGHNGIKSIMEYVGKSTDFPRMKVGIGRDSRYKVHDYVLGRFGEDELSALEKVMPTAIEAVDVFIENDIEKSMNMYNN